MKKIFILPVLFFPFLPLYAQTVSSDTDWKSQKASLKNTMEADYIIRLGDVDNLGFGWPEGFDPFCGRMTVSHPYPWDAKPEDLPGMDRILLSSKYNPDAQKGCGIDGYSGTFNPIISKPVGFPVPLDIVKGATVNSAYLQLFIDDFQAPSMCSSFQLTINGTRFVEGEKIMNAIDQSGPVGKLVTLPLPEDFFPALIAGGILNIKVDEALGAADGFAIDFIRLLINRKKENTCKGSIRGTVVDKETQLPIANARVATTDNNTGTTNEEGRFFLENISAGFEVISGSAEGYSDSSATADIGEGDENNEVMIFLPKGSASAQFDGKNIKAGETINLNNILFDQGKSDLRPESKTELDKIAAFLKSNPSAQIELSGHTSSEGDAAYNRSLSYRRVKACKEYILLKGIDTGRISAVGLGPDRPIAPNDTEPNRAMNRRVEMRVLKL